MLLAEGNQDVGNGVNNRHGAKHRELERDVTLGRVNKLRNEGKEKGCRLGYEHLSQHASWNTQARPIGGAAGVPFRTAVTFPAGGLDCPNADPDQIGGTDKLERRE